MTGLSVEAEILAARDRLASHTASILRDDERVKKLERQIAADTKAFSALADQISQRNVAAIVADESLPPENPAERARLQGLQTKIAAGTGAIAELRTKQLELRKQTASFESQVADAFWPWKVGVLNREMTAVQAALTSVATALASLAALDGVQTELVGERFVTTPENRPATISSERIVAKFIAAIPDRLRPTQLSGPAFQALTQRAAAELHASLKGQVQ